MAKITRRGYNMADIVDLLRAMRNRVFDDAGLAVNSGGAATFKTANTVKYCIDGLMYTKAAASAQSVSGLTDTGAGEFCKVRVEIDTAGTISVKQGGTATAQVLAKLPKRSASKATLGYIEIPASFDFGTTALDAAGVDFVDGDPDMGADVLEA